MKNIADKEPDISINIEGIQEPIIDEYFRRLNNSEYIATAELFAEEGCLKPPFDNTVEGRMAIATYFEKEAIGMKCHPKQGILLNDSINTEYQIQGQVQTKWFTVNVAWLIELNTAKEIMTVEVKLLASLNELLNFKRD